MDSTQGSATYGVVVREVCEETAGMEEWEESEEEEEVVGEMEGMAESQVAARARTSPVRPSGCLKRILV